MRVGWSDVGAEAGCGGSDGVRLVLGVNRYMPTPMANAMGKILMLHRLILQSVMLSVCLCAFVAVFAIKASRRFMRSSVPRLLVWTGWSLVL